MFRRKTQADLERARAEVTWLDDDDARDVESKSRTGATLLGLFTWGGGRLYLGDWTGGGIGIAALVALAALSSLLPGAAWPVLYWAGGALMAAHANRGAKQVNRLCAARDELRLSAGPDPANYKLLAAAAAVNPDLAKAMPALPAPASEAKGPHAELVERLRKVHALNRSNVINAAEFAERKLELLQAAAPSTPEELDDLLFALMPLGDDGVLDSDDFELVKSVAGSR